MKSGLLIIALGLVSPSAAGTQVLSLVGKSDLGGAGLNGDITVVGSTAVVGAGLMPAAGVHAHLYNPYPCPAVTVKLVDVSRPASPVVVGTIPVPEGVAAHGVAARRVSTPAFRGDLLAIALQMCGPAGSTVDRGVAYYDITRPAAPVLLGRYMADFDVVHPDSVPQCGPPPDRSGKRCASSQHSVALTQRGDGRVFSLSLEPGASAGKFPSGDLRVVDVTDPRKPVQTGAFPPPGTPIFSTNGCRPFSAGHGAAFSHDGNRGLLAFYDGGLFVVDVPVKGNPQQLGQFKYPTDRSFEGSAAYVTAARVNGRDLALISETDFIAPTTTLAVDGPGPAAGSMFGCEAIFTLYDPGKKAQLYHQPDMSVRAPLEYIGRGCATSTSPDMHADMAMTHDKVAIPADLYLGDPKGRIALIDRGKQPIQGELPAAGSGCSIAARVRRAQEAGARGVVVLQTSVGSPEAFSPDGDPAGVSIPVMMIDRKDGDALRTTLCPTLTGGRCAQSTQVMASMRDAPGEWGALRIVDVTEPGTPREVGVFRTSNSNIFPPPDFSVFSPQRAAVAGSVAIVPWNSDGARAIDIGGNVAREVGSFVPPDVPDPLGVLPAKAYVVSVAIVSIPPDSLSRAARQYVLVSDVNSGLYVLEFREPPAQRP